MNWWTSEPILYTKADYEGHRLRFLVAEKRARISTRIDGIDDFPSSLNEVNPEGAFPILVDKNLVCYGPALDELIHERYPSPALLPIDPIKRAQVRMLADNVRAAYSFDKDQLRTYLVDVEASYKDAPTLYMAGNFLSTVDIALAPLLHEACQLGIFTPGKLLAGYVERLQSRPAFTQSLRSSTPASPEEELNTEVA